MSGQDDKNKGSVLDGAKKKDPPMQSVVDHLFRPKKAQPEQKGNFLSRMLGKKGKKEKKAPKVPPKSERIEVGIKYLVHESSDGNPRYRSLKVQEHFTGTLKGVDLTAIAMRGPIDTPTMGANKPDALHLKEVILSGKFGPDSISPDRAKIVLVGAGGKLRPLEDICVESFDRAASLAERSTNERTPRSYGTVCNTAYAIATTAFRKILDDSITYESYAAALFKDDLEHSVAQALTKMAKEKLDADRVMADLGKLAFNTIDMHARLTRLLHDYMEFNAIESYADTDERERKSFVVAGLYGQAIGSLKEAGSSRNTLDRKGLAELVKRDKRRKDLGVFDAEAKGSSGEFTQILATPWSIKSSQGFTSYARDEVASGRFRLEACDEELQQLYRQYTTQCLRAKIDAPAAERVLRMVMYGGVPTLHSVSREKRQEVIKAALRGTLQLFHEIGKTYSEIKKYLPDDEKEARLFVWALTNEPDSLLQRHLAERLRNIHTEKYAYLRNDPVNAVTDSAKSFRRLVDGVKEAYLKRRLHGSKLSVREIGREFGSNIRRSAQKPGGTMALARQIADGRPLAENELTGGLKLEEIAREIAPDLPMANPAGQLRGASRTGIQRAISEIPPRLGPKPGDRDQPAKSQTPTPYQDKNEAGKYKAARPQDVQAVSHQLGAAATPAAPPSPPSLTAQYETEKRKLKEAEAAAKRRAKQQAEIEQMRAKRKRLENTSSSPTPPREELDDLFLDDESTAVPLPADVGALTDLMTRFLERFQGDPTKTGAMNNLSGIIGYAKKLQQAGYQAKQRGDDLRQSMQMQGISDPGANSYLAKVERLESENAELHQLVDLLQKFAGAQIPDASLALRAPHQVSTYGAGPQVPSQPHLVHPQQQVAPSSVSPPNHSGPSSGLTGYIETVRGQNRRLEAEDELAEQLARQQELLARRGASAPPHQAYAQPPSQAAPPNPAQNAYQPAQGQPINHRHSPPHESVPGDSYVNNDAVSAPQETSGEQKRPTAARRTTLSTLEILEAAKKERARGTQTGQLAADFLEQLSANRAQEETYRSGEGDTQPLNDERPPYHTRPIPKLGDE